MTLESKVSYPFPLPCPFEASPGAEIQLWPRCHGTKLPLRDSGSGWAEQGIRQVLGNVCLCVSHSCLPTLGWPWPRSSTLLDWPSGKVYSGDSISSSARGPMSQQKRAWELALLPPATASRSRPHLLKASLASLSTPRLTTQGRGIEVGLISRSCTLAPGTLQSRVPAWSLEPSQISLVHRVQGS